MVSLKKREKKKRDACWDLDPHISVEWLPTDIKLEFSRHANINNNKMTELAHISQISFGGDCLSQVPRGRVISYTELTERGWTGWNTAGWHTDGSLNTRWLKLDE